MIKKIDNDYLRSIQSTLIEWETDEDDIAFAHLQISDNEQEMAP